ncbi:MAG TPA: DUF2808 domain-containing protein [Allocoleopsis sp.]
MFYRKLSTLSLLSALTVAAVILPGVSLSTQAQGLPGLTIFSGVDRADQLGYRLDYFGRPGGRDRYRLRIPSTKMQVAASEFFVDYPDTYEGRFNADKVRLKVNGDEVALEDVVWDQDNRVIEIYPTEPVPANTRIEIVLSDVQNPRNVGIHYFNASVISPGDVPLRRYVGTWIVSIGDNGTGR